MEGNIQQIEGKSTEIKIIVLQTGVSINGGKIWRAWSARARVLHTTCSGSQRWKRSSTDKHVFRAWEWICVLEKWMDDG